MGAWLRDQTQSTTTGSQAQEFTIDAPAMEDGDVLYCWFNVFNQHTLSAPVGWTEIDQADAGSGTLTGGLFRKVITDASSEPANYTFTWDSNNRKWAARLLCVAGADTADPEEAGAITTGTSSPTNLAAVTATSDGSLRLVFAGSRSTANTQAPKFTGLDVIPWAVSGSTAGGGNQSCSAAWGRIDTGSSGVTAVDYSTETVGIQIAVNPAASEPAVAYPWDVHRSVTSSDGTSHTVTLPDHSDNDTLVAVVAFHSDGATITPPSGWTEVAADEVANTVQGGVWIRTADSEPASYTWTTSNSEKMAAMVYSLRNAAAVTDVVSSRETGSSSPWSHTGITPASGALALWVGMGEVELSVGVVSTTTPATLPWFVGASRPFGDSTTVTPIVGFVRSGGSATGTVTVPTTANDSWQTWMVSFAYQAGSGNFGDTDIDVGAGFGGSIFSPGTFQDITGRIRRIKLKRGRQHELDKFEAGTAVVTLNNRDGELTPGNTASAFSPDVVPMVAMRLQATNQGTTYPLFYGYVEQWPPTYPGKRDAVVDVTLVDLFKVLSQRPTDPEGAGATRDTLISELAPVAYWRLSGSGATADATGNGHTLTWNGTPDTEEAGVWTDDESVDLDGSDDYATSASASDITTALEDADLSVEAWFYVGASQSGNHVVAGSVNGGGNYQYVIRFDADAQAIKGIAASHGIGTLDAWYHAVVTMEWSAAANSYTERLYVNGVLRSTALLVPGKTGGTFNIGRDSDGTDDFFNGNISEVGVFDVVLTDTQAANLHASQTETPTEGERSDERITQLLGLIGFTDTDFQQGSSTMGPREFDRSILGEIQIVEATEDGQFFMAADGQATFHDRYYRAEDQATSTDTFDSAIGSGDLTFYDLVGPQIDDDLIFNEVTVTPVGFEPASDSDASSQTLYGVRNLAKTINPEDPNSAGDLATWLLNKYADPQVRIARFEIRLGIGSPNDLWATVLGAEIGDRYTIKKALEGDDLNQDFYLEAITMDIRPAEWKVVWELSPANAELTDFWQLGDSTNGVLGTTTKLGY